jgi:hypothetical protein
MLKKQGLFLNLKTKTMETVLSITGCTMAFLLAFYLLGYMIVNIFRENISNYHRTHQSKTLKKYRYGKS